MRYLVTYLESGFPKAFYTDWFDSENNFNIGIGMIVFDLANHQYTSNGLDWIDIDFDHL